MIDTPSTRQLLVSLNSVVCPACAGAKKCRNSFCVRCYRRLPHLLRHALYDRMGHGYEKAITEAMDRLGATTFTLPPGTENKPCKDAADTCMR